MAIWFCVPGDEVEVGPFKKTGMDVQPILFLSRFPTVLIFARGTGLAAARALVEAQDTGSLNFMLRQEGRLYVSAPSPSELPFKVRHRSRIHVLERIEVGVSWYASVLRRSVMGSALGVGGPTIYPYSVADLTTFRSTGLRMRTVMHVSVVSRSERVIEY